MLLIAENLFCGVCFLVFLDAVLVSFPLPTSSTCFNSKAKEQVFGDEQVGLRCKADGCFTNQQVDYLSGKAGRFG